MDNIIEEIREDRAKRMKELKEAIAEYNPEALLADGFEDAIMGYDTKGTHWQSCFIDYS